MPLVDEMGLGKTIQLIAMIAYLKGMLVPGPYIVVAPLAILPNWVREFEKWLPSLPVVRHHGPRATRDAMLATTLNLIFENEGDQVLMSAENKQLQLLNDAAFVQPWISCQTLCGTLIQLKFIIFLHYYFQ